MSLRIRVRAKSTKDDEPQLSGTMPSSTNRRKLTKRGHLTVQSDDENSDRSRDIENSANILPRNDGSSRSHMAERPDGDNEADDDSRFLDPRLASFSATTTTASAGAHHRRSKGIANDAPPPSQKKQAMKENVSEDEYAEEEEEEEAHTTSEDENYMHETKRPAKGKGRQKQTPSKSKSSSDVLDSSTKGERKPRIKGEAAIAAAAAGTKRSRTMKSSTKSEDSNVLDVVGDTSNALATSPQSQPPPKEPSSPPAKKRKLPTIKKNKPAPSVGPSTPSHTTTSKSTVSTKPNVSDVFTPTTPTVRMTPAMAGNMDFDLRNASVYAELFGASGGIAPRSGLSRREKDEERRRELNKMRDEARAKKLAETTQPFDLQAQYEKISRFEEKLRQSRSSAVYPNFLAGKWRELWDRQQRRECDKERQNRSWVESTKEDGEMNED